MRPRPRPRSTAMRSARQRARAPTTTRKSAREARGEPRLHAGRGAGRPDGRRDRSGRVDDGGERHGAHQRLFARQDARPMDRAQSPRRGAPDGEQARADQTNADAGELDFANRTWHYDTRYFDTSIPSMKRVVVRVWAGDAKTKGNPLAESTSFLGSSLGTPGSSNVRLDRGHHRAYRRTPATRHDRHGATRRSAPRTPPALRPARRASTTARRPAARHATTARTGAGRHPAMSARSVASAPAPPSAASR